jgi:hypothetical protein
MMCLGWTKSNNCGRKEQVVPACSVCPDITWFWAGLAFVAASVFMGGKNTNGGGAPAA